MGYEILGKDKIAADLYKNYKNVPLIVTPDKPANRKKLALYYSQIGFQFCNLISPSALVSKYADIGKGVTIHSGANVSSMASVGDFVRINCFANIMHDTRIGKFCTIAPNVVVLGRVKIFESCYIGSNATVLPEIVIGENAVIGAGAVVTKDVSNNATVVGNPARVSIE
jgi:sugar O-acyltransferase (sialic acid O-acetyltransferase NeuD family)